MADDDDLNLDEVPPSGDEADEAIDDDDTLLADGAAEPFVDSAEPVADEEPGEVEDESTPRRGRRPAAGEPMNEQARKSLRARLESDVEAFLNKGGTIEAVPMDVRTDVPKKPESKYGSRSI